MVSLLWGREPMEETGLVLEPFIKAWALGGLAAVLIALSVHAYRRTTRPVAPGFRRLLLALRTAGIALLVLCLLRPSLQITHHELVKRPLVLLIDQSLSMGAMNDTAEGVSRLEAVNRLL